MVNGSPLMRKKRTSHLKNLKWKMICKCPLLSVVVCSMIIILFKEGEQ